MKRQKQRMSLSSFSAADYSENDPQVILHSWDYDRFELTKFNRDIENFHFLEKSMQSHGWIDAYPMHVIRNGNTKLKIKAGHHRFETAKKLGIPVKYVICDDDATIYELEKATRTWNLKDYLKSFVRAGNKEYEEVYIYYKTTGINLKCCISMLGGESARSGNQSELFKTGAFRVGDRQHSIVVADLVKHCEKNGISFSKQGNFVSALSKIVWVDELDVRLLKHKIKQYSYQLEKQTSIKDYIGSIALIYNLRNKERIPLEFLADEKAKERSPIKSHK